MEFTIQNIAVGKELHSVNVFFFFWYKSIKTKSFDLGRNVCDSHLFLILYIYIYFNLTLNEFCLKLRTGMAQLF